MTELKEHEAMECRACGREERASEGYPCEECGTFICQLCAMRGVTRCERCAAKHNTGASSTPAGDASSPPAAPAA